MPVTTRSQQSDLLERIDDCLSTIEARSAGRERKPRRRGV
jgi:hypothetical protein